ncbi:odorant receptor 67c-like isoform X2 [Camponotus floridanus]|uniref:odorant receptor 67c-like isoform X2 n=1 Tax=Camponotus floridanus TaxID=104421 RepID=UPI000DC6C334|nr:odorant receptor 67c-like isoform X2 [Camponotus floridanus]
MQTTISRLVRFNLHIYGIWPYVPSTVLFRLYWIIMLSTAQVFQYRYVIVNIHMDDFSELMDGIGSAMASSLLYIKLVLLWSNQRIFFDLLQMMSADWQDRQDTINSRVMTETQNAAQRASRWIIGLQIFAVINYTAGVLANNLDKEEPYKRELILKMELPFNISTNSIYTAVQSVQFYHLFFVACGITTINSLLVTLILHISGQIDIFRERLMKAFSKSVIDSEEITMQSLIVKHQKIIVFSESIENLFTYIAFMILLSDTIIICCLGYVIATSKMIGNAAYDSLWYNLPSKQSRIILFIILRSQKRLTITSGKIMDLSLERFTSVIKASASYLSLLLAMY